MATVLQIARHAGVTAEDVLCVLMGEPIRFETEQRVRDAVDELGLPPYPRPAGREPAPREQPASAQRALPEVVDALPSAVGTVVYEAVRVEVKPVAEGMAQMGNLVEELFRRLDGLSTQIAAERRERVDDLALLTDVISTGWRSVDRRLGRFEAIAERAEVARLSANRNGNEGAVVSRLANGHGR